LKCAAPEQGTSDRPLKKAPEIREAEETGASLSQGAAGGEAQTLDLTCTSWVVTSGLEADSEDDKEIVARRTLERGLI
jgi:hypothetical protein